VLTSEYAVLGGLGKPDITAILKTAAAKCEAAAAPLGDAILDGAYVLRQVHVIVLWI
jgi:hypothetical protein